jgi:AcrR family transcriptional regulator
VPKPKQVRDADKTKAAILSAATQLFAEKGFIGASISDIAEIVGVSKSSIYHYFPSKEAILHSLIDSFAQEVDLLIQAADKYKLDQSKILTEFAEILIRHQEAVRLAPVLMPGAPKEIQEILIRQHKNMLKILVPGIPTKEKMMRGMLALTGVILSIAPPPMPPNVPRFKPDIKLIVKIALDTLGASSKK